MSFRSRDDDTRFQIADLVALTDRLGHRRGIDAGNYVGTPGDDDIKGSDRNDVIDVSQGGDDRVRGGPGSDTIYFGAAYTAADKVRGATGTNDTLIFDGDYSSGLNLAGIHGIETYVFRGGSYTLRGSAGRVTFDASGLTADESFTIDYTSASRVVAIGGAGDDVIKVITKDEALELFGGDGNDVLIGDSSSDTFSDDTDGTIFNGGGGADLIDMSSYHWKNKVQYDSETDSTPDVYDTIKGFFAGEWPDKIRLYFDADKTKDGIQHYFHLGSTSKHVGDIVISYDAALSETIIKVFTDGDNKADFVLHLSGTAAMHTYNFDFTP